MGRRIFAVYPDADTYRQAFYPESANSPRWAAVDAMLARTEAIEGVWQAFDMPSVGRSELEGDLFQFRSGTLAIRDAADKRLRFRNRFKGSVEHLPFFVDGNLCHLVHFSRIYDALDYSLTDYHRISNGAIIAGSGGMEVFRSDFFTDDWLFRIVGNICIYTVDGGPGSFYEIYHNEGMTGLEFHERRFAP